jgi:hypothetical protein
MRTSGARYHNVTTCVASRSDVRLSNNSDTDYLVGVASNGDPKCPSETEISEFEFHLFIDQQVSEMDERSGEQMSHSNGEDTY